MKRRWLPAGIAVMALGVILVGGMSVAPAKERELSNCFWVEWWPPANTGYPDKGGVYWYAEYELPAGAKIMLRGQFAHARYQALNSYDAAGRPTDALNDVSTTPDRGSSNPFIDGARRNAKDRSYTVEVLGEAPPTQGQQRRINTLYAGVPGQRGQKLVYRVFVPDRGRDVAGDAGLPQHELRLADSTVVTGQAACDALKANPLRNVPSIKLPMDQYLAWRSPTPNLSDTHPAFNPPQWEAFLGPGYSRSRPLKGTPREGERARIPVTKAGGSYSNKDVDYIMTDVDRKFGPLLVLRGKAPITPRTFRGDEVMAPGQVRYWSICQNESLATTRLVDCLYDEQVPVDRDGFYTIVMSLEQERPANATSQCGVAWLDWGTKGDGVDRPTAGFLLVRHLLPAPTFKQAFQNVVTPGTEEQVLGPYLPRGTYMSRQQFEARGCPPAGG